MTSAPACLIALALAAPAAGACQASSAHEEAAPPAPAAIEVRGADGAVTARISPGRPCRAVVEGLDVQIGGRPLVMMVGATRWAGLEDSNGITLQRDGAAVARIFPLAVSPDEVALFDAQGVALLRARRDAEGAVIANGGGVMVRTVRSAPQGFRVGDMTVTGTNDVLLAAVLSAPEAGPEVRALAACARLLPAAEEVKAAF